MKPRLTATRLAVPFAILPPSLRRAARCWRATKEVVFAHQTSTKQLVEVVFFVSENYRRMIEVWRSAAA